MKTSRKYIFLFAFICFLSSCEKTIDIDVEQEGNRIVLNGLLEVGKNPRIKLYESKFILNRGEAQPLRNAEVAVYENGVLIGTMKHQNEGTYVNEAIIIKPTFTYTVKVTHLRLPNVEATVQVPAILKKEAIDITYQVREFAENGYSYRGTELRLKLKDIGTTKDYYTFNIMKINEQYSPVYQDDTVKSSYVLSNLVTDDPSLENIYIDYTNFLGLRDELFNGGQYTGTFKSFEDLTPRENQTEEEYNKNYYVVRIVHLNEALYQYYLRLEDNRYPEAFTEPTQAYSNVENGYGILGALSIFEYELED